MAEIRVLKRIDGNEIQLYAYNDGSYNVSMEGVGSINIPAKWFGIFPVDAKKEILSAVKYLEKTYNAGEAARLKKQKDIDEIVDAVATKPEVKLTNQRLN